MRHFFEEKTRISKNEGFLTVSGSVFCGESGNQVGRFLGLGLTDKLGFRVRRTIHEAFF